MSPDKPNHVHVCGDVTFGSPVGLLHSVNAVALAGLNHEPHVHIRFCYGLSLDLSPATATELARQLPEALAQIPFTPDVHDAMRGE